MFIGKQSSNIYSSNFNIQDFVLNPPYRTKPCEIICEYSDDDQWHPAVEALNVRLVSSIKQIIRESVEEKALSTNLIRKEEKFSIILDSLQETDYLLKEFGIY